MNNTELDGRELVGENWPYDGPHSSDTVMEAARAIDELVTYLSNATAPGNGEKVLKYGPTVYRVLGALGGALAGLDQVLKQIGDAETRIGESPKAYDDRRDRPAATTTSEVTVHVELARKQLETARASIALAHSAASHIGHD